MVKNRDNGNELGELSEIEKETIHAKIEEKEELRETSGIVSDTAKGQGSALHKLIGVSEQVNQLLALANFRDFEEADNVAAALKEADRYGVSPIAILQLVSSRCGVCSRNLGKVEWGVEALTHLEVGRQAQAKMNAQNKQEKEKVIG